MALNKLKINKKSVDHEFKSTDADGNEFVTATFKLNRIDAKISKAFDGINKSDLTDDEKEQARAEVFLNDVIIESSGVTEEWLADNFIGNDTHCASRTVTDDDGDTYSIMRATFESAAKFYAAESYEDKAKIAVNEWLEDWSQSSEPGGPKIKLTDEVRNEIIGDGDFEPLIDLIFSSAILQGEYKKKNLSTKDIQIDYERHIKGKERAILGHRVFDELFEKANNYNNFIEEEKKKDIKQGKN